MDQNKVSIAAGDQLAGFTRRLISLFSVTLLILSCAVPQPNAVRPMRMVSGLAVRYVFRLQWTCMINKICLIFNIKGMRLWHCISAMLTFVQLLYTDAISFLRDLTRYYPCPSGYAACSDPAIPNL